MEASTSKIRRFMEGLHDLKIAQRDSEPVGGASVLASRLVSSLAPPQATKGEIRPLIPAER